MENQINDPRWFEAIDAYNADEWGHALALLQAMAAEGITQAYDKIGCIYEHGYNGKYGTDRGVKQDYTEALKWYQKAFESGYGSGALGLASVYLNSENRDYQRAFHYLSLLKKYHLASVYRDLAMLYDTGQGVKQDRGKAKLMYLRAIAKGDKMAFGSVGVILAKSSRPFKGYCLVFYGMWQAVLFILRGAWEAGQSTRPKKKYKTVRK